MRVCRRREAAETRHARPDKSILHLYVLSYIDTGALYPRRLDGRGLRQFVDVLIHRFTLSHPKDEEVRLFQLANRSDVADPNAEQSRLSFELLGLRVVGRLFRRRDIFQRPPKVRTIFAREVVQVALGRHLDEWSIAHHTNR